MRDARQRLARGWPTAVLRCLPLLVAGHVTRAGDDSGIVLPHSGDEYSAFVRQLEAGQTDINYTKFRQCHLESRQFKSRDTHAPDLETLRGQLHESMMKHARVDKLMAIAMKMLSVDYTDMEAHKVLRQSYKALGDIPNSRKYHDIEFGLFYSIIRNGDGKTCATAWPVVQVSEEYFLLQMLGARIQKQSIDTTGGLCDRMEVHTEQGDIVYYFEISRVLKAYDN